MDTRSFPGVNRLGRVVAHPPPSSTTVKDRVELYLYSTFVACSRVVTLRNIYMRAISSIHCNVSTRNVLELIYRDTLNVLVYSRCTVTSAYSV
jgi:hypothetical protein